MNKIKYTIVPKDNVDNGMMQVLFAKDVVYRDILVIDNAALGIVVEKSCEMIKVATESTLESTIKNSLIDDQYDTIILNGFDISLDDVKNIYVPIAREHDIYICINVISTFECADNITIHLDFKTEQLEEEDWQDVKERILLEVEAKSKEQSPVEVEQQANNMMLDMFKQDTSKLDDIEEDCNIIETYMYSNVSEEINIHRLKCGDIIINNGDDEVLLSNDVLKFVIESLTAIK